MILLQPNTALCHAVVVSLFADLFSCIGVSELLEKLRGVLLAIWDPRTSNLGGGACCCCQSQICCFMTLFLAGTFAKSGLEGQTNRKTGHPPRHTRIVDANIYCGVCFKLRAPLKPTKMGCLQKNTRSYAAGKSSLWWHHDCAPKI